jgi:hypothetical protein
MTKQKVMFLNNKCSTEAKIIGLYLSIGLSLLRFSERRLDDQTIIPAKQNQIGRDVRTARAKEGIEKKSLPNI